MVTWKFHHLLPFPIMWELTFQHLLITPTARGKYFKLISPRPLIQLLFLREDLPQSFERWGFPEASAVRSDTDLRVHWSQKAYSHWAIQPLLNLAFPLPLLSHMLPFNHCGFTSVCNVAFCTRTDGSGTFLTGIWIRFHFPLLSPTQLLNSMFGFHYIIQCCILSYSIVKGGALLWMTDEEWMHESNKHEHSCKWPNVLTGFFSRSLISILLLW